MRNKLLIIEDHEDEIQVCFKDVEPEFDWARLEWHYCDNAEDAWELIHDNRRELLGVVSDVWVFRSSNSRRRPDPKDYAGLPPTVDLFRRMQRRGVTNVPVYVYSRFFSQAGDGRTSDAIRECQEDCRFIVHFGPLDIEVEKMMTHAISLFREYHGSDA